MTSARSRDAAPSAASTLRREISAHHGFFPAAILCGLVTIPVWAALYRERPGLMAWHGHEMLLGYGLAVVAGFLLARIRRDILLGLIAAWLVARAAVPLGAPVLGGAAALGFAGSLAVIGAYRFLRAAKKGRNRLFGVVLVAFALAEIVYQAGVAGLIADGQMRGVTLALDLITLLMLQMGGRVIPAATAGIVYRRGGVLANRVQPWIETAIGGLMAAVIVADQLPGLDIVAGLAALSTACLALVRLARWRPFAVVDVPDVIGLHAAYGWLVIGLALKGAAAFSPALPSVAGVHALGVGALGTLTTVMMARTAAGRSGATAAVPKAIALVVALLALAAVMRIGAAFDASPLLIRAAAAAWTAAFVVFAVLYRRAIVRALHLAGAV